MYKWPSFVVATAKDVRLVTDSDEKVVCSGRGLYYGISWSHTNIYLLARAGVRKVGHPDIFVLDKDFKGDSYLPGNFLEGHQIHCDGDDLYVTSTAQNAIEVVNLSTNKNTVCNWTQYTVDRNHINSIWKDGDSFWVGYHSWHRPGDKGNFEDGTKVIKLDSNLSTILEEHVVGHGNHNVARVGNLLYICSSGSHELVVYDMDAKEVVQKMDVGYWVRGLGITDEYIVMGATAVSGDRAGRETGDGEVYLLDRHSLAVLDIKTLANAGSVYELRLVGCADYAHNGIDFPGRLDD